MFKSKLRPVVVPQWEHEKLAGTLALLWGNDEFAPPPIAADSFLTGVALHDRAYGHLDNLPIGAQSEETWREVARRGFAPTWADPVAEVIARLHIQRLVGYGPASVREALAAGMEAEIAAQIAQTGLPAALFARIDRITRLCDNISFAFCFEAPAEGTVEVFAQWGGEPAIPVHYRVAEGVITVDPWPFGVRSHSGYLVGYEQEGYPERLEPVMLRYELRARA